MQGVYQQTLSCLVGTALGEDPCRGLSVTGGFGLAVITFVVSHADSKFLHGDFATAVFIKRLQETGRITHIAHGFTTNTEFSEVNLTTSINIESLSPGLLDASIAVDKELLELR